MKQRPLAVIEVSRDVAVLLAALVFGIWLLLRLRFLVLLILTSSIIALGLAPSVDRLVRLGLTRRQSVAIVMAAVLATIVAFVALLLPSLVQQFHGFQANLPALARHSDNLLGHLGVHLNLQDQAQQIDWNRLLSQGRVLNYGQQFAVFAGGFLLCLLVTMSLLVDMPSLAQLASPLVSERKRLELGKLTTAVVGVAEGYLRGQLILSLVIGAFSSALLFLIGVDDPLAFGLLAALANIVPEVGGIVAVAITTMAALQDSETQALIVLLSLLSYHQLQARFIGPKIYSQTVHLPPILALIAVLTGGFVLGVLGVLIAVPVAGCLKALAEYAFGTRAHPNLPIVEDVSINRSMPQSAR